MAKFLAPPAFPRRPSGLRRYAVVGGLILLALWTFYHSSSEVVRLDPNTNRLSPNVPVDAGQYTGHEIETAPAPNTDPLAGYNDKTLPGAGKPAADDTAPEKVPGNAEPNDKPKPATGSAASGGKPKTTSKSHHPIDKLIYDAQHRFAAIASAESKTVSEAAQAYRKRRGRHPPPNFDKWFEFARSHNAVIVEEFFDQIYHDLGPFWAADAAAMRREASQFEMTINVRNGTATAGSEWFWTKIWLNMTKSIEKHLPDMDLALNAMDEPRIVVPFDEVNSHMKNASKTIKLPKAKTMTNKFRNWPAPGTGMLKGPTKDKNWEDTKHFWKIVRRGCPKNSLAMKAEVQESHLAPPNITSDNALPHLYKGYVGNYTLSTEVCHQPDLQNLEGVLIRPLSTSATKVMFPMFGGSKLIVNNEILLPAPMYWNEEERFTGGDDHGISWEEKKSKVIWRGVATGGTNTEDNWRGFQRHRFVAMANGTKITRIEAGLDKPENFVLPGKEYGLQAQAHGKLGEWVNSFADVGFTDLSCSPPQDGKCNYTDFYYKTIKGQKMAEQFDNKFLPDIDGNSFSGRYLGFLRSTSLPIKSTLWREWHDSRLVPWKHFVPMDNRFTDFYGIMDYFVGYGENSGHDQAAEKIASEGKEWAELVLRKEDMLIYVFRLLLEYARVLDEDREKMGWVDDVIADPSLESKWSWWWS